MPKFELVVADASERPTLARLMQLYAYDFSEVLDLEVDDSGRFAAPSLDSYWDAPLRSAFLGRAGERLAGFALVHCGSRLSGADDVWDMAEFFVLRKHRRCGVGSEAAHRIFREHRGKWEVRQRRKNVAATAFWRRAIGSFGTTGFAEVEIDDARWCGPVQCFTS